MAENKAKQFPQYLASSTAAFGAFALGTVIGWANVVQEEFEIGETVFKTSKEDFTWIGASFMLGCMFVCMPAGQFINLIGRKGTIIAMSIPFTIGWLMVIFAPNIYVLCVARFILGFSGGSSCVSVPVYTTEIAEKNVRGLLGSLFQFMVVVGILFMYSIGAVLSAKVVSYISLIFPVILGVIMIFMPESPVYLIKKNRPEAANKSFEWLRGKDYDAKLEIDDIKTVDAQDKANPVSIIAAFKRPETKRAFLISVTLMFLQQASSVNVVMFYSTDIFRDANTGFSPDFCTVLIGLVQVFATFASMVLVDRLGRKMLLCISAAGMALCTCVLGVYFIIKDSDPDLAAVLGLIPVTSLCLFIIFFSIGYGPIPWLMMGEIFSTDIKGFAGSLSATLNWMCAFFVVKGFVALRVLLTAGGAFFLFTILTFLGIFFVVFVAIETKGKTMNEIQAELVSLNKPKE